eukprot:COSAG06_NODE_9342_length_1926_cov_1.929940_1_plen_25_part_10
MVTGGFAASYVMGLAVGVGFGGRVI